MERQIISTLFVHIGPLNSLSVADITDMTAP